MEKNNTNNKTSLLSLSELKKGEKAKVVDILTESRKLRQRFFDMGITKEVIVEVKYRPIWFTNNYRIKRLRIISKKS